ncbi:MAG: UDP-N-acetylmuramoyl-tripeptide--D-alanyl-D-alanine ligase [Candidatus Dependentiae bacterium ADurb.Bin331]|nr:MAG: UDP-N-acetylmuramoyl-tripeptide--D-alanyl-D-alanine ligase [Candidatus Dependentiae bacterium ADurb.Bin331]
MAINAEFIKKIVPECFFLHAPCTKVGEWSVGAWSIDSRTVRKGEMFVALRGSTVDGHDFIAQALERGAAGCMIAKSQQAVLSKIDQKLLEEKAVLVVEDPKAALIALATAWRKEFTIPVIGITGSIGKTSTKESICSILQLNKKNYLASEGTQNTVLGVSLTLLTLLPEHSAAIIELGISRRGEMAHLVEIVQPTIGVITAVGHSHMEGLGSINDIAAEKREIFKYFKEDSIGIINGDQPLLASVAYKHPVIKFGSKTTNQVQARKIHVGADAISFNLKLYGAKYTVTLPTNHKGAVFHLLAAVATAYLLGVPTETIIKGIEKPINVPGRFERRPLKNGKGILINDAYNASPESMKAALTAFAQINTQAHKIAVLGDMLELGVNSAFWHRQIGRFLRKVPAVREVILVGNQVQATLKTVPLSVKVDVVPTWKEAVDKLKSRIDQESCILVKGSRGIALNNLVDELT